MPITTTPPIRTGQDCCYDDDGRPAPCAGSGQDGEWRDGLAWPTPRFVTQAETVVDRLTDLTWSRRANPAVFPMAWQEALDFIAEMNAAQALGHADWRLPNRRELHSLMDYQTKKPALPAHHPFLDVFLGWYWTSTTAAINPRYAWHIHLEGARMFYGRKDQEALLWPVRGQGNGTLAATGQHHAHDTAGRIIAAQGSGQDGELRLGVAWPSPRFRDEGLTVLDRLTNLRWLKEADLTGRPVDWQGALAAVADLNRRRLAGIDCWRLPTINALESLVDCSRHDPALPAESPFLQVREGYWSSTTSFFETAWAWALYLDKGALGVGYKPGKTFHVWAVTEAAAPCRPRC
jgi:hypothetical protein